MDHRSLIKGSERFLEVFGRWPSFHDAEVVRITLDRGVAGEDGGPSLEALVHAFEMTSDVGPDGSYVLRNHVLVHFLFREVASLRLEGWNHQNALFGLKIADVREYQQERIRFEVSFDDSFGVGAAFGCRRVEILSVVPCTSEGRPLDVPQ